MEVKNFEVWDYVVFAALFVISSGIGVFFAIRERKKATSREFLVGGRQMTFGPVALSLTASFMSAVTVLGTPAEVYRFGASFIVFFIAYAFVIIFTSELFLPVFYRSGITSTYEYLQLRFNKPVRYAATAIYILQTILYTGVVVYAPALALNQVTGFDLWGSVFATGIVCTFYCTLGGLKAVVWTDAFQMVVMTVGFLTVLIRGSADAGGLHNVLEQSANGSRLNIFDFDVDPLRRHTFWTISVGGTFTWLGIYGVNQSTIQRCISCKTEKHAKLALYFNLLGLWVILACAVFSGLIMYSHFKDCDPWTSGIISAPDQLMPYFVMELFATMPGLPGLFVACAFSGTLSTVAASINALATVTFEDFVKSCFPHLSDKLSTWMSKGLCLLFGVICTSMAVAASLLGSVVQAALSIHGMCGGPMLGLFSLGILFPFVNWKGALGGLLTGIILSFWVAIGALIYPAPTSKTWPLPLSTDQCVPSNVTESVPPLLSSRPAIAETWYALSYLYYSAVGCLGCMAAGVIISFATGHQKGKDIQPLLIRPVCNLFCFWSKKYKTLCSCGVQHDSGTEQENLENGSTWKQGDESVLRNGLRRESLVHVPGYEPKDKNYDNMALEKITHF
ncbi:sodium-coupled monocarboxylate transporter 2 [Physeter macrocephalus]|uniref:Sodium-coupled monocarboxylate transporter 2 n=1 Tax=Physeter macrocephalus TaxID=9755 RepID=A0A2Y9EUJ2_PHYMC|nr:sodium-coupled monocarboxylate transporter 2 [Physeter catodon]|eukprot:XP_007108586.1 sodium-coupled monocarboxylate transporter 2 [Physeter catodon]